MTEEVPPVTSDSLYVEVGEKIKYRMDGYLKSNLDIAIKVIRKDWDMVFLYDGVEGGGKSVKAMQDAYYCDPTFNIDRIAFTPREFIKAIMTADKYQAVIYDEAFTGLSSREAMGNINRTLVKMLAEIRQKNLFVFIVMPTFFDLDKYAALWRSRALIHIYTLENFERGAFAFYNIDTKKELYINGKKYYSYKYPSPNFYGKFSNTYVVDEIEYKKRKREALTLREAKSDELHLKRKIEEAMFERVVLMQDELTLEQKAKLLDISRPTWYVRLQEYNDKKALA